MAAKKRTFPGSIFLRGSRIYIKFKGRQIATGLRDTQEGWKIAEHRLREMYHEMAGVPSALSPSKAILVNDAFQRFLREHCSNKTPKTVRSYSDAFHKIVSNNYYVDIERIRQDIVGFVSTTLLSGTSVNIHLRSFQVFLTFCYKRQYTPALLQTKDFKKSVAPKVVQVFTHEETSALIAYFATRDHTFSLLLRFAIETGWRIKEILDLTWSDIDTNELRRIPKDKNRADPTPMTNALREILADLPKTSDKVFPWKSTSQSSLLRRLNKAMEELGIPKANRGWHTFRKTATNRWLDRSLPIEEVQTLLGHQSITTTRKHYTKVNLERLGKKLDATQ